MDVIREIGGVEEKLRYVMDYELWLQFIFRYGTQGIRLIPDSLAVFRLHDESKTVSEHRGFIDEMASVLLGLCRSTYNDDLVAFLEIGHDITPGLRSVPTKLEPHQVIVRKMVLRFLFKWNAVIGNKKQFRMMRGLVNAIDPKELGAHEESLQRFHRLKRELSPPSWNLYRVKRKLRS